MTAGAEKRPAGATLRQVSLRRLKEFGVRPKRDLGQNFLIDDNILGVILEYLECRPDDVVLEVGAGLGVLTEVLSDAAAFVHTFEIDKKLTGPLAATLEGRTNIRLHLEDILKAPLEELDPPPTICASNLPYSVAGPFLVESLRRLPGVRRYCVMVQKEVADRIAAAPTGKTYGALSVWVQLYAEVVRTRLLSRAIFHPKPNVDSSLIVLDRRDPAQLPEGNPAVIEAVIRAAFGQRRKTLVNALSAGGWQREAVFEAVRALDLPENVRAERLAPPLFVDLAARLGAPPSVDAAASGAAGAAPGHTEAAPERHGDRDSQVGARQDEER